MLGSLELDHRVKTKCAGGMQTVRSLQAEVIYHPPQEMKAKASLTDALSVPMTSECFPGDSYLGELGW